jgi:hypothetical protein
MVLLVIGTKQEQYTPETAAGFFGRRSSDVTVFGMQGCHDASERAGKSQPALVS